MSAPEPSKVGSVIASKYRLDEELGRGGMGAVYRAFHLRVHKVFALKMLLGDIARHKSIASRFLLEAQAAGRIGHPGILDVYDVGEDTDGTPFIVMELLRGEALASLVRRERLEVEAACWVAMEVLDVLEAAHKAGIIHRDVKPQNVFITEKPDEPGRRGVKLLDFGIAKFGASVDGSALTRSGEIIGSPLYMAPEQAKGEPDLDARADIWSVGAMLFEMLTGQCAHVATTPVAVLAKILTEQAPAPSTRDGRVPPELDDVVTRALKIDRAERWPSAKTMRDAIAEVRAKLGASSLPKIPAAVKISVPPASNDRTPGAITSTVAGPSDAPRPWSHAPTPVPAPISDTALDVRAAGTTVPSANAKSRTRNIAGGIGALIVLAAFAPRIVARLAGTPGTSGAPAASAEPPRPTGSAGEGASAGSPSSAAPSGSGGANAAAGGSGPPREGASTASAATAPSPALVPVAIGGGAVDAGRVTTGTPTGPRCQPGEVLSGGHCCAKGLEWQNGRCERPIATSF